MGINALSIGMTSGNVSGDAANVIMKNHSVDESRALFERLLEAKSGTSESSAAVNKNTVTVSKTDKLYEQCLELETFLMKNIVNGMRKTVMKSELIDTGLAGEMYEDMLYDEYAKIFTENANFGLASMAYLELTGQQGKKLSVTA